MNKETIDFKKFPVTRYQGSKRKLLPWIYDATKELRFRTVLDACGGSGSVSYLFKKMGKQVTYNDKLHFNYLIGKALIENSRYKLTSSDIENLLRQDPNNCYKKFISTNFKNVYFLDHENEWLDTVVNNVVNMNHYQPKILEYKKALAYYAIFQASLIKRPFNLFHRKNLEIRTNEVKRNFGNKTTWEKKFEDYLKKFATEANCLVFDSGLKCISKNESIFEIDEYGFDLVYIDIPYISKSGSNESSNYLRCYHFLEGMSHYSEWPNLIDYNSINLQVKGVKEQNDFLRDNIHEKVEEILVRFRRSKIIFSYKKGGAPSISFIVNVLKKLNKKVCTKSMKYKYALNRKDDSSIENREVLIIAT